MECNSFKWSTLLTVVKLQSKVQTLVLGLGVCFVFPLSQEEQEQQQEEPSPKSTRWKKTTVLNFAHGLKLMEGDL